MGKINPHDYREPQFDGPLKNPISNFLHWKRQAGYKYNGEAMMLQEIARLAQYMNCPVDNLSKDFVLQWIEKRPTNTVKTYEMRYCMIRQLGTYMKLHGYDAYIAPQINFKTRKSSFFAPYIFNKSELKRFFEEVDSIHPHPQNRWQHLFYPLLYRLLLGCGLRLNEALTLKIKNVKVAHGILSIQEAKFGKARNVPMCRSLTDRCSEYLNLCHGSSTPDDLFFPSPKGGVYSHSGIYFKYRDLLRKAHISYGGRGHGPRIHDFRHTYAVYCLRKWLREKIELENALLYLSIYMGHCDITGTHTYLRLTTKLFPEIIDKTEAYNQNIIPIQENKSYEND